MSTIEAIIIAIVEGLTEFLPISSTGHMIITEKLLGVPDTDFTKLFTVAIQLGAILAVVVLYHKKFLPGKRGWNALFQFYLKLAVGVIPALVLGKLFIDKIDEMLESPTTVAITLLIGGFFLLFIDKIFNKGTIDDEQKISFKQSLIVGFWQCLAMIPGMSRSAASIIGGMQQGLTRSAAAEFSFFLAVPTMLAATTYKLISFFMDNGNLSSEEWKILTIGNAVAFIVAMLAIKFFIHFLKKYGFRVWGIYRIIVGVILLIMVFTGYLS